MSHITFHDVSQHAFLALKEKVLTLHDGVEVEGNTIEAKGVRCAVSYEPTGRTLEVVVHTTPQIVTSGYVVGWLCDQLAGIPE